MNVLHGLLTAFYLQGGLAVYHHVPEAAPGTCWRFDLCETRNPYGTVEAGLQSDLSPRFHVELAARHASSIAVKDHGINSIEARVRWQPFR